MNLSSLNIPPYAGITADLIGRKPEATGLFPYDFQADGAALERFQWLSTRSGADRKRMAALLEAQNRRLGAPEAVLKNIERLRHPDSVVVVTGQQTGFLTGPLYTLYKAVTALKLASAYEQQLQRPVIPVFWMATEDHDYSEVALNWHWDGERVRTLRLPRAHGHNTAVGALPLPAEATGFANEVLDSLRGLPHEAEARDLVEAAVREGQGFGDAFGSLMLGLLGRWGLVMLDASDPELRRLERPFFRRALHANEALNEAYVQDTQRLAEAGYSAQLQLESGHTGLFMNHDGERCALLYRKPEGRVADRKGRISMNLQELSEVLESEPERFSTGASLRPILQDWLLPVLAAVLGPGEMAYHAQLTSSFEVLDRQLPLLVPRESWRVGSCRAPMPEAWLEALLTEDAQQWMVDRIAELAVDGLGEKEQALTAAVGQSLERFSAGAGLSLEESQGMETRLTLLLKKELQRVRRRLVRGIAAAHPQAAADIVRAARLLKPLNRSQERILLPWHFYGCYGAEWIDAMVTAPYSTTLRWIQGGTPS